MSTHPIIVVTGANGGVGFGVCQRLLEQLSSPSPSDAQPQSHVLQGKPTQDTPPFPCVSGLTLILACRNERRAEEARQKLLLFLDNHIRMLTIKAQNENQSPTSASNLDHAQAFKRGLCIEFVKLDLSTSAGVFSFCDVIKSRYSYLTYLVLNAGGGSFTGIDWGKAIVQGLTQPKGFVSAPVYKIQASGETNPDGYGWVWHCNVFGHYIMTRELSPLLKKSPISPARILWTSSLEGQPKFYDHEDWQLITSAKPYEGSKYQIDLIGLACGIRDSPSTEEDEEVGPNQIVSSDAEIRHIVIHPSVTATDVFVAHIPLGSYIAYLMFLAFYIARLCGSQIHPIKPFKGAISATHAMLAPLSVLPSTREPSKLGSRSTFFGSEYVGVDPIVGWKERQSDAFDLLAKCERLYIQLSQSWQKQHGAAHPLAD